MIAAITADNDQDNEEVKEWLREASDDNILAIWLWCQRDHSTNPVIEVVSRLAALKLAELYLEVRSEKAG